MNYIDMFVMVLLIWAIYRGYTRGFIMQIAILAALVLGIFAALKLSGFTVELLQDRLNFNPEALYLIATAVTFLLVFIGVNLVGRIVEKVVESIELSFANRAMGIIFSLAKTLVIVGIILAFADRLDRHATIFPDNTKERSLFYKPLTNLAGAIFPSLKTKESPDNRIREFVWTNPK